MPFLKTRKVEVFYSPPSHFNNTLLTKQGLHRERFPKISCLINNELNQIEEEVYKQSSGMPVSVG